MRKIISLIFSVFLLVAISAGQNKKPVEPQTTKQTAAVPVSYGLVVDNSGSFRMMLEKIVEMTKDIAEENKPDDETFLVRFVSTEIIKIVQEFTVSKDEIHSATDEMYVEGGLTSILDAVDFSARYLAEKGKSEPNRLKVLVLISDGDDRRNTAKIEDVVKFLKENDIRVFAVGISDEKVSTKVLDKLTRETGGKKYVPKTRAEIPAMIKELAAAIRTQ